MASSKKSPHESIAPVLSYIRAKGITQAAFAQDMKLSDGQFTNWKARGVPHGMQAKVAAKIGMSTDEYLAQIGRPTGATPLQPDEQELLDAYRKASPRWRLVVHFLVNADNDMQDEVSAKVHVLMAKIRKKPATNDRLEETYGLPPGKTRRLI